MSGTSFAKEAAHLVTIGASAAKGFVQDVLSLWGIWAIIIVVGVAMLVARAMTLWVAPEFATHSKEWATTFNILCDVVLGIEVVVEDITRTIVAVIEVVKDLMMHPHGFSFSDHKPKYRSMKFVHIDTHGFHNFFVRLIDDCAPYNTVESIALPIFRSASNRVICPPLRYLYPVPQLYEPAVATLGWAAHDSRPWPHGNCQPVPEDHIEPLCIALGAGYIVIEILLPAVLLLLIIMRFGPVVARLVAFAFKTSGVAFSKAVSPFLS